MKNIITYIIILFGWCGLAQTITDAEYFFNSDPGFGLGEQLSVDSNTGDLTQTFQVETAGLPEGFNSLYVRTKNSVDIWSLYSNQLVYIKNFNFIASEVTEAEIFIDSDPGFGLGTSTVFNDPSLTEQTALYSTGGTTPLSEGFHILYVRVRNAMGDWSLYCFESFFVDPPILGVEDNLYNTVDIYPNPFINTINFSSSESLTIEKVTIYDLNGRTVYQGNENLRSLDLGFLTQGVYILELQANDEIGSFKIVKE